MSAQLICVHGFPKSVKNITDSPKQFKSAIKNYLHAQSFYSKETYFRVNRERK